MRVQCNKQPRVPLVLFPSILWPWAKGTMPAIMHLMLHVNKQMGHQAQGTQGIALAQAPGAALMPQLIQ